jgi:hypothetical protein
MWRIVLARLRLRGKRQYGAAKGLRTPRGDQADKTEEQP